MSYRSFFNEAGRKIRISVGKGNQLKSVHVVIQGPYSESENEITEKEAKELYTALGDYLFDRR